MRNRWHMMLAMTLIVAKMATWAAAQSRMALVIGNNAYEYIKPLANPINDANAMTDTLKRFGFTVSKIFDGKQQEMEAAIRKFARSLHSSDTALVFYAGHGVQVNGLNYMVPVNADIAAESEVKYKAVEVQMLMDALVEAGSRVNIIILDACRDNPFRGMRSLRRGLAAIAAPPEVQTFIAYATAPGEYAQDGVTDHSPFTAALLRNITKPGLTIEQVFKQVRMQVKQATATQQTPQVPWDASSLIDEVYFAAGSASGSDSSQGVIEAVTGQSTQGGNSSQGVIEAVTGQNTQGGHTPTPRDCWANERAGATCTEPTTGMEFVYVPGGSFEMGSPESEAGRSGDEGPVHRVTLKGFWMGKHEVTNAQYRRFKADHNSQAYEGNTLNGDDQPAVYVSWNDAQAFVKWLTQKNRGQGEFRLPSEAEWEYAARAGTTTARFWGDDPNDACAYANVHDRTSKQAFPSWTYEAHDCTDNYAVAAPVGSFAENAFGLFDMLGNVWEWCADTYHENYNGAPKRGEMWGSLGEQKANRMLRGGSWSGNTNGARCASRSSCTPAHRGSYLGLRVVRSR